jgi:hypothetical protein
MSDELAVKDVRLRPAGERVAVEIPVANGADRTLHAYATARKILYDPSTKKLTLELTDEGAGPLMLGGTFVFPKFVAVDPGQERTIELDLPAVIHRMAPGADQPSPTIENLPIHEATSADVKLAWSDTPFYPEARETEKTPLDQLQEWQTGTAQQELKVKRGRGRKSNG